MFVCIGFVFTPGWKLAFSLTVAVQQDHMTENIHMVINSVCVLLPHWDLISFFVSNSRCLSASLGVQPFIPKNDWKFFFFNWFQIAMFC